MGAARAARFGSWKTSCTAWSRHARSVLSDKPLFFLINTLHHGSCSLRCCSNMLRMTVSKRFGGTVDARGGCAAGHARAACCPAARADAGKPMTEYQAGRYRIGILYEDNHLLIALKPQNMPVQARRVRRSGHAKCAQRLYKGKVQQAGRCVSGRCATGWTGRSAA